MIAQEESTFSAVATPADRDAPVGPLLAALTALFATGPLLYPGFIYSQRGIFAAYELAGFAARPAATWLPAMFGGPSLAQGPLPYWLGRLLMFAGLPPTGAIKWLIGLAFVALAVGVYVLARHLHRGEGIDWAALAAAAIAVSLPYVQSAAYVRGDLAEIVALALVPWALWSAVAAREDVPRIVLSGILWSAIGLTHVGIVLAGVVLLAILRPGRSGWAGPLAGGLLVVIGWLVIAARAPFVTTLSVAPADLAQVFSPAWQAALTPRDGLPISLGVFGAVILVFGFAPLGSNAPGVGRPLGLLLAAIGLVAIGLAWTTPIWQRLPAVVSQPYQWIGPAGIALAVAAAAVLRRIDADRPPAAIAVAGLAIAVSLPNLLFQPVVPAEPRGLLAVPFGEAILLADARSTVTADRVTVDLVWLNRAPVARDLTVFAQLIDKDGAVAAQHDGVPVDGVRPTSGWLVGEAFGDRHEIRGVAAGSYRLIVGLYDPRANGARVRTGNADSYTVGEVVVR